MAIEARLKSVLTSVALSLCSSSRGLTAESSSPETSGGGIKGLLALMASITLRASRGVTRPSLLTSGNSETSPSPKVEFSPPYRAELIRLMIANGSRGDTTLSKLTSSGRAALCQGEAEKSSRDSSFSKPIRFRSRLVLVRLCLLRFTVDPLGQFTEQNSQAL